MEPRGDEVTLRGDFRTGNHLKALLDFCLMSAAGVSQHCLLYTYFSSLEIPTSKTNHDFLLSLLQSLKSYLFLIAGALQLGSKYGFRGNSISSL